MISLRKKIIALISALATIFTLPMTIHAARPELCGDESEEINSAFGCIPVGNTQIFAEFLLRWGMGIGGGLALLLIGYGGFMVVTSGGNPQKAQAGKELITAAVAGLLFIIFSAFILRLVGIDILGITQLGV